MEKTETRIAKVERRIGVTEDEVDTIRADVASLSRQVLSFGKKNEDLEFRSRHNNLRIIGVLEENIPGPMEEFVECTLLSLLDASKLSLQFAIEQAHRSLAPKPKSGSLPCPIIAYLLNYRDRDTLLQAARAKGELLLGSNRIHLYPDFSIIVQQERKTFVATKKRLCDLNSQSLITLYLRPHLESKAFAHNRLHDPLGGSELGLRTCTKHNKLLEYYCVEHGQCLCCNCLTDHKACKTDTVPEAKRKREENLRSRRATLHDKIENVSSAFDKLSSQELKVLDAVNRRKTVLKEEFSEISTIIQLEEQNAMRAIEEEEKRVKNKFAYTQDVLHKKKREFENYKDKVDMLLSEEDDIIFLMKARKLNDSSTKDAYVPKIDCDETLLHNISRSVYCLKEMLRNQTSRRDRTTPDGCKESPVPPSEPSFKKIQRPNCPPAARGPSATRGEVPKNEPKNDSDQSDKPVEGLDKRRPRKKDKTKKSNPADTPSSSDTNLRSRSRDDFLKYKPQKSNPADTPSLPDTNLRSRDDFLKYAENLSLDFNTAHKRVVLTEGNTKIAVTDTPRNYNEHPQRFTHCSQVLGYQGFARGIHYWEVEIRSSNFCGIGVSYNSIDRRGTESRLGRNKVSRRIEWFNAKLSAWHNDVEEILHIPSPDKVGVLLNCDEGHVNFFALANKTTLLYKFKARFTEAVYPAFWVFSSNTTLAVCPLKKLTSWAKTIKK
ncbi:E3 ubiquitin/ISG15 ligase TRIM25-like [Ambystoma mexicanum]|uniref:E3 ubiquitin/ISG15 ligase TRIM25-like n=1 Tax=Ambystoma mexicanum TaxID=8296 RepID=UPI0037E88DB8